jgi:DNA-binding cell septation regulator SpoVG
MREVEYKRGIDGGKVVEITPNKKYEIKEEGRKSLQVRRGTVLVEHELKIMNGNKGVYEQMFGKKYNFPFCL